jgi:D-sedoheptulose 7-phosphate isomerase
MSRVDELYRRSEGPAGFAAGYLGYLQEVLAALDPEAIGRVAELLLETLEQDRAVWILGNGGSAATANHMANDLVAATRGLERGLRVCSLSANPAVLTATANDQGYEQLFVQQLRGRVRPGDVVIALSASGSSPNVLRAVEYAAARGAVTVGFTGFDGGALAGMVDHRLHAATPRGDYGPVEDAHLALDHILGGYLARRLRERVA